MHSEGSWNQQGDAPPGENNFFEDRHGQNEDDYRHSSHQGGRRSDGGRRSYGDGGRGGRGRYYERQDFYRSADQQIYVNAIVVKKKLITFGDIMREPNVQLADLRKEMEMYLNPEVLKWAIPRLTPVVENGSTSAEAPTDAPSGSVDADIQMKEVTTTATSPDGILDGLIFSTHDLPENSLSAVFVNTILECVKFMPAKHSYYLAIWLIMVKQADPGEGEGIRELLTRSREARKVLIDDSGMPSDAEDKTETAGIDSLVKAEMEVDDDEEGVNVKTGNMVKSVKATHIPLTPIEKIVLFHNFLFECFLVKFFNDLQKAVEQKGGFHSSRVLASQMRFLADLVNVGIISQESYFHVVSNLMETALNLYSSSSRYSLQMADWTVNFILGGIPWLSFKKFAQYDSALNSLLKTTRRLMDSRKKRDDIVCSTAFDLLCKSEANDNIDRLLSTLRALYTTEWVSKSSFRLYEGARTIKTLTENSSVATQPPTDISSVQPVLRPPFTLTLLTLPVPSSPDAWASFCHPSWDILGAVTVAGNSPDLDADLDELNRRAGEARREERGMTTINLSAPPDRSVVHRGVPKLGIFWTEWPTGVVWLECFPADFMRSRLNVALLTEAEKWMLETFIMDTIFGYFTDVQLAAETVLRIPVHHNQFVYVVVETILNLFLTTYLPPLSTPTAHVMSSVFVAHLLHRLIVLEKDVLPVVVAAFKHLLEKIESFTLQSFELILSIFSRFSAYDIGYPILLFEVLNAVASRNLKGTVCQLKAEPKTLSPTKMDDEDKMKLSHDSKVQGVPEYPSGEMKKDEFGAEPKTYGDIKEDKKALLGPFESFSSGYAKITTLETAVYRFAYRFTDQVSRLLFRGSFLKAVPQSFHNFVPELTSPLAMKWATNNIEKNGLQETRSAQSIVRIQNVSIDCLPPLEYHIIRSALILTPNSPTEVKFTSDAVMNFLLSRLGKPLMCSLKNLSEEQMDTWFHPTKTKIKKDDVKAETFVGDQPMAEDVTKIEEVDNGEDASLRFIVKTEVDLETPEDNIQIQQSTGMITEDISVTDDSGAQKNSEDIIMKSSEPKVKGEYDTAKPNPNVDIFQTAPTKTYFENFEFLSFSETASEFRWTFESLSKLLINTLLSVGSRTLSHLQKSLDLYGPLMWNWKQKLIDTCGSDLSERETKRFVFENVLLTCILDFWMRRSASKCHHTVYQFLVNQVLTLDGLLHPLFTYQSESEQILDVPLFWTIGGDTMMWDLIWKTMEFHLDSFKLSETNRLRFLRSTTTRQGRLSANDEEACLASVIDQYDPSWTGVERFNARIEQTLLSETEWDAYLATKKINFRDLCFLLVKAMAHMYITNKNSKFLLQRFYYALNHLAPLVPSLLESIKAAIPEMSADKSRAEELFEVCNLVSQWKDLPGLECYLI